MFVEIHNSHQALSELRAAGVTSGTLLGLAVGEGRTAGCATATTRFALENDALENGRVAQLIADVDAELAELFAALRG